MSIAPLARQLPALRSDDAENEQHRRLPALTDIAVPSMMEGMGAGPWLEWSTGLNFETPDMEEVAAAPIWHSIQATRIAQDAAGPIFVDEIAVRIGHPWRVAAEHAKFACFRVEVKVRAGQSSLALGDEIAVCGFPYGTGFVARAPFKRGSHHASKVWPSATAVEGFVEMAACDRQPRDCWESGGSLTAGLTFPPAPKRATIRSRQNRQQNLVYGIVSEYDTVVEKLRSCDAITALHKQTAQRTLRFSPHVPPSALHENTLELAPSLLDLAIHQALSGPRHQVHRWLGRPVAHLVSLIYRGQLNRANRQRRLDTHGSDDSNW